MYVKSSIKMLKFFKSLGRKLIAAILDFPLVLLIDVKLPLDKKRKIPNILITTVPARHCGARAVTHWKEFSKKNSEWSFLYFDNERQTIYMKNNWGNRKIFQIFMRSKIGQMKSDIFRYCYLYDNGGVYLDFTKGLKVPIDAIVDSDSVLLLSLESVPFNSIAETNAIENFPLVQYMLATSPKSELFLYLIEQIELRYFSICQIIFNNPKRAILEYTGPIAFSLAARQYNKEKKIEGLKILGFDYFNSINFSFPGSNFFKDMSGDYAEIKSGIICE